MRKKLFSYVTSYPFLLVSIIACFVFQSSYGQALFTNSSVAPVAYLYDWCKALPVHEMFLPVLGIQKNNFIPGPLQIRAPQLAALGKIQTTASDSTLVSNTDSDTAETKDAILSNQSIPGMAIPPAEAAVIISKPSSNLSGAIFDEETDLLVNKYAVMISVAPEDVNNFRLYKFIDTWYGVKYKWGGYDLNGIDCSGFTQKMYTSLFGVTIERTAKQQHKACEIVKNYNDASEGDLVFFRIHHLGVSHVGVYLANGYFVHASRSRGVTISNLDDKYWRRRYAGCGRLEKAEITGSESGAIQ